MKIGGRDIDRLVLAGGIAAELGLEVWFCPELWGRSPNITSAHIQKAAASAEELRRRWPDQVVFNVGTELSLFMRGVVPGRTFARRVQHVTEIPPEAWKDTPLRDYLTRTAATVRRVFDGPITYSALPTERVDWEKFDIIGIDHYWHRLIADRYRQTLQHWLQLDKPTVISELCVTQRAEGQCRAA